MCGCLAGGSGCNTIILTSLTDMSGGQQALGWPGRQGNRALCPSSSLLVQGRCRVPDIRKRRQSTMCQRFRILRLTVFSWSYDPKQVTWPSQTEGLEKQTQHPDERSWESTFPSGMSAEMGSFMAMAAIFRGCHPFIIGIGQWLQGWHWPWYLFTARPWFSYTLSLRVTNALGSPEVGASIVRITIKNTLNSYVHFFLR